MPYDLRKRNGLWYVVGPGGAKNKKGYESREKALAYMRALYVHSPEARKKSK